MTAFLHKYLTPYVVSYIIITETNSEGFFMSKFDKLIKEILSLSKDLRFSELKKVLEYYGYTMESPRSGSSHFTFRKKGCNPITIPKHEPIKRIYVQKVKEIVEADLYDEK